MTRLRSRKRRGVRKKPLDARYPASNHRRLSSPPPWVMDEPPRIPRLNKQLGYVRTPVGTVRVEPEGLALFASRAQIDAYEAETGVIVPTEAMLVELDNAGKLLFAFPDSDAARSQMASWVDTVLEHAREYETEEVFLTGLRTGLKAGGPVPALPAPPLTLAEATPRKPKRPPRPGSMREQVRAILADAGDWLSASDVAKRAPQVIGRPLKRRSVYNALVKEVKRGGIRRWEKGGLVYYRVV